MVLVMMGGALGSGARYAVGSWAGRLAGPAYPYGTLAVNLSGGVLMGVLAGVLARAGGGADEPWRLFLGVGVLGGYTTFSAFALDAVALWMRGAYGAAAGYVALSVAGGLAGLVLGLTLARVAAGTGA